MPNNVLVVIGAGASHDLIPGALRDLITTGAAFPEPPLATGNASLVPPLTSEVFRDDGVTQSILRQYPGASTLVQSMRVSLRTGVPLEQLLKFYSEDEGEPRRSQFIEVPLYLQEFFGRISQYTEQPINYSRLADLLFGREAGFDRIMFITLNYETLLDDVLFPDYLVEHPDTAGMNAYVGKHSLVKLHGSVNWSRSFSDVVDSFSMDRYLQTMKRMGFKGIIGRVESQRFDIHRPSSPPWDVEAQDANGTAIKVRMYYPAMAVPLGVYDATFSCPREHLEALRDFLPTCRNVLVIGFSAQDEDLLDLLRGKAPGEEGLPDDVSCLHVVDDKRGIGRVQSGLSTVPQLNKVTPVYHRGGFSGFTQKGGLEQFIEDCQTSGR